MIYKIMDVNAGGETVARIESNNGKNALRRFRRLLLAPGAYEIKRGYFNWAMFSDPGGAWYAMPEKKGGELK